MISLQGDRARTFISGMTRDILTSVNDTQWAAFADQPKINRAAQRRAHAAERADLVAALGWSPEGRSVDDKYPSTTGELRRLLAGR